MATYGSNFYGLFKYGAEPLVEFSASPFTAVPHGYKTIRLSWTKPSGEWSELHVVRNTLGFPTTPDDGDLILSVTNSLHDSLSLPVTDTGSSVQYPEGILGDDKNYYYSIFVDEASSGKWYRAGDSMAISVKDAGTTQMMYDYIPLPYKQVDLSNPLSVAARKNLDLEKFLGVFAFEYDYIKCLATKAKDKYDTYSLDGRLVPLMMNQFGFNFESEMGIAQGRRLLHDAAAIYLMKGSSYGIKAFSKAFTGYTAEIAPVKNLLLSLDDSSFENGVGYWTRTADGTLSSISGASESPLVSPYSEPTSPAMFPNADKGILKVVAGSGTTQFGCGILSPGDMNSQGIMIYQIPVTEGVDYTFSIYSRAKTTGRSLTARIWWYDRDGVGIGSTSDGTVSNSTSSWTRLSVSGAAVSGATFAGVMVGVSSTVNGEVHYFDAAQFEEGSSATDYVDARRVDISLQPNRVNLIKNPSFESSTDNWYENYSAPISIEVGGAVPGSNSSLKVTAAASSVMLTSLPTAAIPGVNYSASAYVTGVSSDKSRIYVIYYDSMMVPINEYPGETLTLTAGVWSRVSSVTTAPSNAKFVAVIVEVVTTSGNVCNIDAVLLEQSDSILPYFDGSCGYLETTDVYWDNNDTVNGVSYYYKNRVNVVKRFISAIDEYMPLGSTWSISTL